MADELSGERDFNQRNIDEFRANGGVVGGPFEGATLLLLHTTGAKSGQPRVSPLAYLTVDGKMIIIGSYAGAPKDPAWVHNLRAHPRAHIEVGTDAYDVAVRELSGSSSSSGTVFRAPSSNATRADVGPLDTTVAAYLRPSLQGTIHFAPLAYVGDDGSGGGGGRITFGGGVRLPVNS